MELTLHTFWFIFIPAIVLIAYFAKECFFKTKDTDITTNITDKFSLVSPVFMNKNIKEQNIENNQEIHENNKKILELEKRIEKIEAYLEVMNNKIDTQLVAILDEVKKRGK
jgi:hypothetical protein